MVASPPPLTSRYSLILVIAAFPGAGPDPRRLRASVPEHAPSAWPSQAPPRDRGPISPRAATSERAGPRRMESAHLGGVLDDLAVGRGKVAEHVVPRAMPAWAPHGLEPEGGHVVDAAQDVLAAGNLEGDVVERGVRRS